MPLSTLPTILEPLAPVQDKILVLSGLTNAAAMVPEAGAHARGTGSFLTCPPLLCAAPRRILASSPGALPALPALRPIPPDPAPSHVIPRDSA